MIEACRLALFKSSDPTEAGQTLLGWGTLNVPAMLSNALADAIAAENHATPLTPSPPDQASFPFWRELFGRPPPDDAQEAMYDTEVAQIVERCGRHGPQATATASTSTTHSGFASPATINNVEAGLCAPRKPLRT